jgi:hypothetical protein
LPRSPGNIHSKDRLELFPGQQKPQQLAFAATDGWLGYLPLKNSEYKHEVTYQKGNTKTASELLPRVHLVISHLKRWMMGTHQGAINHKHLDYYLDEFTFRFNPRRSKSCGKLFSGLRSKLWQSTP